MGQFLVPGLVGGAEEFLIALTKGLLGQDVELRVSLRRSATGLFAGFEQAAPSRFRIMPVPNSGTRFLWEVLDDLAVDEWADVVLCPNYFLPPSALRTPHVVVLHDVQHARLPQLWAPAKRRWLEACHRWALSHAHATVTVSDFSRAEILDVYGGLGRGRLHVIPNPIDWATLDTRGAEPAAGPIQTDPGPPYFLTVGSHYPHKNLTLLAEAFSRYVAEGGTHRWVVAGQPPEGLRGHGAGHPDLPAVLAGYGATARAELVGRVSQAELNRLMSGAAALVFPSLYEGFGRPAAEALGMGTRVLCARRAALPEVTLGYAHFVDDPLDVSGWTRALHTMAAGTEATRSARPSSPPDGSKAVPLRVIESIRRKYALESIARRYVDVFCDVAKG